MKGKYSVHKNIKGLLTFDRFNRTFESRTHKWEWLEILFPYRLFKHVDKSFGVISAQIPHDIIKHGDEQTFFLFPSPDQTVLRFQMKIKGHLIRLGAFFSGLSFSKGQ
ncbi:hypothetical protein NPIL_372011 [Nephila pilipes]|uniref:Uncharacterized protein n=1 Tax=Nephila pilipes TaxID=299642 RepID=A0A8X6QCU0_NEPPI|nr:hypothetical protein NPIL_372011 [Nephila pilipes]